MKRQVKLLLVLSAAAGLSAGIYLTSYAGGWMEAEASPSSASKYTFNLQGRLSSGWVLEGKQPDGRENWAYYRESGERVREDWIKSGENWYWLDGSGQMAAGQLLEIKNNYYYFDENGVMARNQWVSFDNENAGGEDEPERHWYYFQGNGRAYRRPEGASSAAICAKEIDGKKYAFDTQGRMLYGWVSDGERQTDEDAWMECDHYFGPEDDGVMRVGWERIRIEADLNDEAMPGDGLWEDEEQNRWFYFSPSGKKTKGREDRLIQKTIAGQKYGFDEYGRMISSWYADPALITTEIYDKTLTAEENLTERQGGSVYTKNFMYFGSPESGARYSKGWFRVVPSAYLMEQKHKDSDSYMYYADGDGNLYANEIRTIDNERYGFDNYGRVISGLVCLTMADEGTSREIEQTWHQDKAGREFSNEEEFRELIGYQRYNKGQVVEKENYRRLFQEHKMRFYYFSGPNNAMLTGKQNVRLGDETVEFLFETSGYLKGSGVCGKRDGRLYQAGWLLKADEYEKYVIFKEDLSDHGMLYEMDVEDFIDEVCNSGIYNEKTDETVYTVRYFPEDVNYYLIDRNGDIVKNKKNAVNIDGYRFHVEKGKIRSIRVEE